MGPGQQLENMFSRIALYGQQRHYTRLQQAYIIVQKILLCINDFMPHVIWTDCERVQFMAFGAP